MSLGNETETEEGEEVPAEGENAPEDHAAAPLSLNELRILVTGALKAQLGLGSDYEVTDIQGSSAIVRNRIANVTWTVPFEVDDERNLSVTQISDWVVTKGQAESNRQPPPAQLSELERARQLRELRLSQPSPTNKGGQPMATLSLDGVELSDEQRAAIQSVLDENSTLKSENRAGKAESRIAELSELGLSERPGALNSTAKSSCPTTAGRPSCCSPTTVRRRSASPRSTSSIASSRP